MFDGADRDLCASTGVDDERISARPPVCAGICMHRLGTPPGDGARGLKTISAEREGGRSGGDVDAVACG
jgi:hypothetical protein